MNGENQKPEKVNSGAQLSPPQTDAEIVWLLTKIYYLLRTIKEERRNAPHTPLKKKGETGRRKGSNNKGKTSRTHAREEFKKPTLEEVAAHIREKGYIFDAETFWNFYESKGWRIGRQVMRSWPSACVTWQKRREQKAKDEAERIALIAAKMDERTALINANMAERTALIDAKMDERTAHIDANMAERTASIDAKMDERTAHIDAKMDEREAQRTAHIDAKMDERTAHIDAKMDEREKKREASIATRRRPINWIGCTEEERKEFCDGLA